MADDNAPKQTKFNAILDSISDEVFESKNEKKTPYHRISCTFRDKNGNEQTVMGIMYQGNADYGVEIGKSYLTTATLTDTGVIVQMSHLSGQQATKEMFDFG